MALDLIKANGESGEIVDSAVIEQPIFVFL